MSLVLVSLWRDDRCRLILLFGLRLRLFNLRHWLLDLLYLRRLNLFAWDWLSTLLRLDFLALACLSAILLLIRFALLGFLCALAAHTFNVPYYCDKGDIFIRFSVKFLTC